MRNFTLNRTKTVLAGIGLFTVLSAPSANAVTYNLLGTYTDSVTNVTPGDNAPSISNDGLFRGNAAKGQYFAVDNLVPFGPAKDATTGNGLLFTVEPAECLNHSHCSGTSQNFTETADINVDFSFYSTSGQLLGTVTDTALATFDYKHQTDNLCWLNGSVGGSVVQSHTSVGTCNAPGSKLPSTGYEQIIMQLGNAQYAIDLYDWNDWNEQPNIKFQLLDPTVAAPEPFTLALLGAGVAGAAAMRRRRKR